MTSSTAPFRRRLSLLPTTEGRTGRIPKAVLASIILQSPDAVLSIDSRKRIVLFNRGAEKMFGYSFQEVVGKPANKLLPSEYTDDNSPFPYGLEFPQTSLCLSASRKDGTSFPAEASIFTLRIKKKPVLVFLLRDATARQQIQKSLETEKSSLEKEVQERTLEIERLTREYHQKTREELEQLVSERTWELEAANATLKAQLTEIQTLQESAIQNQSRNRALLEAIPDMIFHMERNGTFIDAKSSGDEYLFPNGQVAGRLIEDVLPKDFSIKTRNAIQQVADSGKPQLFEYQLLTYQGVHYYEARVVKMSENEVLILVRNVSERLKLEQMKTDFIHRAAHELRTPLATISLMADLLQEGGTEAEIEQYWAALKAELQRQKALMEDILTMGKLESGGLSLRIAPVDLSSALADAINAVTQLALSRRIAIIRSNIWRLPIIYGDKHHLTQVFINLLDNAIKFSREGGNIEISAIEDEEGVLIKFKDYGIGIPAADLPSLFNRFVRASNAALNEIPGSGVGLFLVKVLIEKMGGHIKVESSLGEGSVFSVWLPTKTASLSEMKI